MELRVARVFEGSRHAVARGVIEQFPDDDDLVKLNAEAYVGVLLTGPDGTPLGHLFGVHDEPLANHESTLEVMQTYAPLVASQMNRLILSERTEAMEEQLEQSRKLESLGVLAGGIAHDFNNLLAAIQGNAELAAPQASSTEVRSHLEMIRTSTHRAAELCRQMLAYAGHGRLYLEEFELEALIREVVLVLEGSLPRDVAMSLALAPEGDLVRADRAQLSQVVANLVNNAVDAMVGHAGSVMVRTGSMSCDQKYLSASLFSESSKPGTFSLHRGERQRQGHVRRGHGQHVRPVLLHEGRRSGSWLVHGTRSGQESLWRAACPHLAGSGDDGPGAPSGVRAFGGEGQERRYCGSP